MKTNRIYFHKKRLQNEYVLEKCLMLIEKCNLLNFKSENSKKNTSILCII